MYEIVVYLEENTGVGPSEDTSAVEEIVIFTGMLDRLAFLPENDVKSGLSKMPSENWMAGEIN